jgi:hypothetical protein
MEEFGDPSVDEAGISEANEIHGKDGTSSDTIAAIELDEIPRVRELLRSVNDAACEVLDESQHCKFLLRFSYLMVMYLAHPPNIPCSGGVHERGTDRRVIRITLEFRQNLFLASRYLSHARGYCGKSNMGYGTG